MRLLVHLMLLAASTSVWARSHVLVVTATAGYRHESISAAEEVLAAVAEEQNVEVSFLRTEEEVRSQLVPASLMGVSAVFFVNTTGELPGTAADALVAWVRAGGTFVGIHSASDTWHAVPAYLDMLGGEFVGHPPETIATVVVDDLTHVSTRDLPSQHELYEEFYYLANVDLSRMRVLLSIRTRPEPPGEPGYWPLAWEKTFGSGRVFYSALGHREDVWRSDWFQAHVAGIIKWAVAPRHSIRRRAVSH